MAEEPLAKHMPVGIDQVGRRRIDDRRLRRDGNVYLVRVASAAGGKGAARKLTGLLLLTPSKYLPLAGKTKSINSLMFAPFNPKPSGP